MPTFVQFTHPGKEHKVSKSEIANGLKQWNYESHRRKFIEAPGLFIDGNGKLISSDLLFWGEWEPESKVHSLQKTAIGDYPSYVHEPSLQKKSTGMLTALPYIVKNNKKKYRRNTDPFVFGFDPSYKLVHDGSVVLSVNNRNDLLYTEEQRIITNITSNRLYNGEFYYSCCKQLKLYKKTNKCCQTTMAQLDLGSIILFGSIINPQSPANTYFALDTVFVVGDYRDYTTSPYGGELNGFVPNEYMEIEGDDLFASGPMQLHFRLYKGANPTKRYNGMYSFVPCRIADSKLCGFERVKLCQQDFDPICKYIGISVSDLFTDNLNTAPKITKSLSVADTKLIWDTIRNIIKNQGYLEGVSFAYH